MMDFYAALRTTAAGGCSYLERTAQWCNYGDKRAGPVSVPLPTVKCFDLLVGELCAVVDTSAVSPISNHSLANQIPQLVKCQQKHIATIKHIKNSP